MTGEYSPEIDEQQICAATTRYSERHGLPNSCSDRVPHFWGGQREWPVLHLDDVSGMSTSISTAHGYDVVMEICSPR